MVSWSGTVLEWLIWMKFRHMHAFTDDQILDSIRDDWPSQMSEEIAPPFIADDPELQAGKEAFRGPTQTWEVMTVQEKVSSGKGGDDKLVVYWHGGAFKNRASPSHYKVLRRLAVDFSCTTVMPRYTLLPLSTAHEWALNAVSFLFSLASDARYEGKEIVLMGDSAGGWMVLRLLEVFCEMALGERGSEGEQEEARRVMERVGKGVMFSAMVETEMTKETEEWAPNDFWLNLGLFRTTSQLWSYGPSAFPDRSFNLPAEYKPLPGDRKPISDPTYSPRHGVDVFARYRKAFPDRRKIRLAIFIATHDLLFPGNEKLAESMKGMGSDAVDFEYHVEQGLYHVYAIVDLLGGIPEYRRAWVNLERILTT